MATRVHRIGNIYSRIDGLIRKGYLSQMDKPVWFDVYRNFPPKYDPTLKRKVENLPVREIFYKEDELRAKLHKALNNNVGVINLKDDEELFCDSLLKTFQTCIAEGMSENEAIEKVKNIVKSSYKPPTEPQEGKQSEIDEILSEVI